MNAPSRETLRCGLPFADERHFREGQATSDATVSLTVHGRSSYILRLQRVRLRSGQDVTTRYTILWHHDINEPHYDLMFETMPRSDLATWRSPTWPIESRIELTRLKDHRRF